MISDEDIEHMKLAVAEAEKSRPEDRRLHPKVGVVVVKDGRVLATAHRGENAPGDHGEYTALEKKLSTTSVANATIYTTLEPCTTRNHPKVPCAKRLIERKVRRVVIGMLDPNPAICGRGFWLLRESNVETDMFPHSLMAEIEEQNRDFVRQHRTEPVSDAVTAPPEESKTESGPHSRGDAEDEGDEESKLQRWFKALGDGDTDREHAAFEEFLESREEGHHSRFRLLRLSELAQRRGDTEAYEKLVDAMNAKEADSEWAAFNLGEIARRGGDYARAAEFFRVALARVTSSEFRVRWIGNLVGCLLRIDQVADARDLVLGEFAADLVPDKRASLLAVLASDDRLLPGDGTYAKAAVQLEAALLSPTDRSRRFDAAYSLSNASLPRLCARHYHTLLKTHADSTAASNNFAVELEKLGLPGMSLRQYLKAAERGETLAASNAGNKFVDAGMFEEAEQLLQTAMKGDDVHENVGSTFARLSAARKKESDAWQEAMENADTEQVFLGSFVTALIDSAKQVRFEGEWTTGSGELVEITRDDEGRLLAEWGEKPRARQMRGDTLNRAAILKLANWEILQDRFAASGTAYAYVSENELRILQIDDGSTRPSSWLRGIPETESGASLRRDEELEPEEDPP